MVRLWSSSCVLKSGLGRGGFPKTAMVTMVSRVFAMVSLWSGVWSVYGHHRRRTIPGPRADHSVTIAKTRETIVTIALFGNPSRGRGKPRTQDKEPPDHARTRIRGFVMWQFWARGEDTGACCAAVLGPGGMRIRGRVMWQFWGGGMRIRGIVMWQLWWVMEQNPSSRRSFNKTPGSIKGTQGPFKGPRGSFKGSRGPLKEPRGPFKGTRGPLKGARGPLKGPRGPLKRPLRPSDFAVLLFVFFGL